MINAIKHLFLNSLGNCRYTFSNGKDAVFLNGEYLTDNQNEIYELNREVEAGHPHISIDSTRTTVNTDKADPMESIRAKIIAEYEAQKMHMKTGASTVEDSKSAQGPVVVANTQSVGEAMSGSTSVDGATSAGATTVDTTASTAKIVPGVRSNS